MNTMESGTAVGATSKKTVLIPAARVIAWRTSMYACPPLYTVKIVGNIGPKTSGTGVIGAQMPAQSGPSVIGLQSSSGLSMQTISGGHPIPALPPHCRVGFSAANADAASTDKA